MSKSEVNQLYLSLEFNILLLMKRQRQVLIVSLAIPIMILVGACGNITPTPVVTATIVPSFTQSAPSITPSPIPTITSTPDFCNSALWQGDIQVMSEDVFFTLGPGPVTFDRILREKDPAWANFRQKDQGEMRSAGVIFHEHAIGPEWGMGVSPVVILVAYGMDQKWKLPINGNLVSDVEHIRDMLFQYRSEWVHGQVDRSHYPAMANGATYALYRYFNGDLLKLEDWCHTYVQVYNESPLK
jgi:hypothetical protein